MSTDKAKILIGKYIEKVWNCGDLTSFEELTAANYTYHLGGQAERDKTGMQEFIKMVHAAFPDWRVRIIEIIAEGNTVAVRWDGHRGLSGA